MRGFLIHDFRAARRSSALPEECRIDVLQLVERFVQALALKQLFMRAFVRHASLIEHDDAV